MPLYDFECRKCGAVYEDIYIKLADFDEPLSCTTLYEEGMDCEEQLFRVQSPVSIVGPTHSKPLNLSNMNVSFDSKKAADDWAKTNDMAIVMPGSDEMRRMKDRVQEKVETRVRKAGYNDREHFKKVRGTEKAKRVGKKTP